jgi:hypothetical protein
LSQIQENRSDGDLPTEFTGNFFSGKLTTTPDGGTATDITLNSASRFGVMFNGGVDIAIGKSVGAVIGLRYNLANLIGKAYDSTNTSLTNYSLDDKEYTIGTTTVAAKNISWLTIYAGVQFAFNKPKNMKK